MKKQNSILQYFSAPIALLLHIIMAYIVFAICRMVYFAENIQTFKNILSENTISNLLNGSLLFDTSAIFYTYCILALVLLLPYNETWRKRICVTVFTIINTLVIVLNFGDAVYFQYTGHRTTTSVLGEFSHENNLSKILGNEVINHWYLFILGILMIVTLAYISNKIVQTFINTKVKGKKRILQHVINFIVLILFIPCCVAGIRGGWTTAVRPITLSNANQYVQRPAEAALILNTPFSLIRTIGKDVFVDPEYFSNEEMNALYSPVHQPTTQKSTTKEHKNIVVLIVESFGREYIGVYNETLENGQYKGYTPFVDSLYKHCLSFDYTFANGRQSIDGMPSILSGIPRFIEPFFVTGASMNDVSGLAGELKTIGYSSAFFHGAENGSMGFEAFAKSSGFEQYFGRTEFNADKRFNGDADFDGTWAIWDEPFMQFYALKMNEIKQPFVTTIFTASSHHPYAVPEKYQNIFKDEPIAKAKGVTRTENPIHKCIEYTDMALRKFFETASKQPWYKNTIFVITSDHTNIYDHEEYGTDLGLFGAPLLFFDPSGKMPKGRQHCIAQQTDIMPTLLNYVGYNKPYVAWGIDLLNTQSADTWAVNHTGGGIYQFAKGDYLLQFDGVKLKAVYNFRTDWMLKHNLLQQLQNDATILGYEKQLKAIIQSYMQRMTTNNLIVKPNSN